MVTSDLGRAPGVALLACVLLAAPAVATGEGRFLAKARQAYDDMDYERVLPLLEKALSQAGAAEEEAEIYALKALVLAVYNRKADAVNAFVEVLRRQPQFDLPDDESPKIREALEEARGRLLAVAATNLNQSVVPTVEEIHAVGTQLRPKPEPSLTATTPPKGEATRYEAAIYETWWFWTIAGAAVVGATAGAIAWRRSSSEDPAGDADYGPYRF